ncbi:hypothetical protein M2162_003473 [Streptomyces sp. SAI-041]|nr:hypothetical protein [Streptomyces sp. SAI-041]
MASGRKMRPYVAVASARTTTAAATIVRVAAFAESRLIREASRSSRRQAIRAGSAYQRDSSDAHACPRVWWPSSWARTPASWGGVSAFSEWLVTLTMWPAAARALMSELFSTQSWYAFASTPARPATSRQTGRSFRSSSGAGKRSRKSHRARRRSQGLLKTRAPLSDQHPERRPPGEAAHEAEDVRRQEDDRQAGEPVGEVERQMAEGGDVRAAPTGGYVDSAGAERQFIVRFPGRLGFLWFLWFVGQGHGASFRVGTISGEEQ